MNLLTLIISMVVFVVILIAIFWVGIYVVLPVVLFLMLISALATLFGKFVPRKPVKTTQRNHQKIEENQVIDVEFEEIK